MRTVAFILDDTSVQSVDLREPAAGNPGIGGTEYNLITLAHELAARKIARVTLFRRNPANVYPAAISTVTFNNFVELTATMQAAGPIDCVVVRCTNSPAQSALISGIPENTSIIAWAHNHLRSSTLTFLAGCERVKRVVYVGREQCALVGAGPASRKSTFIFPGFYVEPRPNVAQDPRAVYVGSLVPQKGFHRLARLWPRIRAACPNAQLDVIGSSRVYYADGAVGNAGVADPAYEDRIMRYLGGDASQYGVTFHGKLGIEKYDVIRRARVGLPNPTGFTECCPASVVEMSQCGTAVIALRQWGMCDTVVDAKTGYLCANENEYVGRIVSLLNDPEAAHQMGIAGQQFVRETFSYESICEQWDRLINDVCNQVPPDYPNPAISGYYPFRRLRVANASLRSRHLHRAIEFADRVRGVFLKRY